MQITFPTALTFSTQPAMSLSQSIDAQETSNLKMVNSIEEEAAILAGQRESLLAKNSRFMK